MQPNPAQSDATRRLLLIADDLARQGQLPAVPSLVGRLAEELAKAPRRVAPSRAGVALEVSLVLLAVSGWPRTPADGDRWAAKAVDLADRLLAVLGGAA